MNDQIIFTKDEVIDLIKEFSLIEGYLFSVKDSSAIIDTIDYHLNLLTERLVK